MEAAAAAMDLHALSRRELQALCKRNGVRANMTNAAMAEALQGLTSVDGIDEIGTTLCLPTPGRSAMKSASMIAGMAGEDQLGSPLPRGRRVSVKSPEAIRMEVEEGEDEMKRDLVKEIVRTPGVALRSTSRRARATPAPLPTPVPASSARATTRRTAARKEEVAPTPATLRRSQRTAGRKAAAPVEVEQPANDVSAVKRPTRSERSKMTMALDQEEEVAAAVPKVEDKVQQEEPKAGASDVKCEDPDDDEVTKLLEGDNKEEEPEEGEEGIVEEKEPTSVQKPASLATMEDSPILGVLSKVEASEPVIEKAQDASLEDDEGFAAWSPVMEMADETNEEAIKEDACTTTFETDHSPEDILPTAAEEDESSEEDCLTEVKEGAADEMPQAELADDETSEEDEDDDLAELKGSVDEMWQSGLVDDKISEEDEEDGIAELKGAVDEMQHAESADDETSEEDEEDDAESSEEIYSTEESDEEVDETSDEGDTADVVQMLQGTVIAEEANEDASTEDDFSSETTDEGDTADVVQMLQGTVIAEEANEDASTEEDDFSSDLPPEFYNVVFSYSDTESDIAAPVLEENQVVVASANKTAVKSLDDSAITEEQKEEVSEGADATEKTMKELDNIVKSLDEITIMEGGEAIEEMQKLPQVENYKSMSLRKLRATYKGRVIASKEGNVVAEGGKRLPLEEVDENASTDC